LSRADGNHLVRFTLSGGGSIAGVDNGDPTNHEPFKGPTTGRASHRTFNGLAIVVLRAPRAAGVLTLTARTEGLTAAPIRVRVQ
jgi:beta-galactosidase